MSTDPLNMPHIIPLLSQKRGIRSGCYNANKVVYKLRVQSQLILCPYPTLFPSFYKKRGIRSGCYSANKNVYKLRVQSQLILCLCPTLSPSFHKRRGIRCYCNIVVHILRVTKTKSSPPAQPFPFLPCTEGEEKVWLNHSKHSSSKFESSKTSIVLPRSHIIPLRLHKKRNKVWLQQSMQ